MGLRLHLLALVPLLAPCVAQAQGAGYERCVAGLDRGGFVKSQMLDCATKDMDRADAALNATYRQTQSRLAEAARNRLVLDERAWITHRQQTCALARQDATPSPEINRMLCLVRETDQRTAELARMR